MVIVNEFTFNPRHYILARFQTCLIEAPHGHGVTKLKHLGSQNSIHATQVYDEPNEKFAYRHAERFSTGDFSLGVFSPNDDFMEPLDSLINIHATYIPQDLLNSSARPSSRSNLAMVKFTSAPMLMQGVKR